MIKIRRLRIFIALVVVAFVVLGIVAKAGFGTVCALRIGEFSLVCPLGFLQLALASKSLLPELWLPAGLSLLGIVILGRFFCGWVCPTSLMREILKRNGAAKAAGEKRAATGLAAAAPDSAPNATKPWTAYTRYALLGGGLVASFLFGFPVFCLVCPVGLFFGTVFAISRLLLRQQPSLELLLYPAILVVELLLLKKWCHALCPMGALLGLIGRWSRVGRPAVDKDKCLTARGIGCRVCRRSCPQGVNLVEPGQGAASSDCTRCLECYEKCPTGAIRAWPLRRTGRRPAPAARKGGSEPAPR